MKWVYPDYYPRFQCIADQCAHNCCIGWEIDIDAASMNRYRRMKGPMGERLRANIDREGSCGSFRLDAEERCPLLNAQGLCDLILDKGEKALCQICRDHPRYRLRLTDREEIGLGLCCEAACRLILDAREPVGFRLDDNGRSKAALSKIEAENMRRRDRLIAVAQDRSIPVMERMRKLLTQWALSFPERSGLAWVERYMALERMDESWTVLLQNAGNQRKHHGLNETQREQLLVYFLYRYMMRSMKTGDNSGGYLLFCVLSVWMIDWLCADPTDVYEVARLYSAEIEYSDENVQALVWELAPRWEEA